MLKSKLAPELNPNSSVRIATLEMNLILVVGIRQSLWMNCDRVAQEKKVASYQGETPGSSQRATEISWFWYPESDGPKLSADVGMMPSRPLRTNLENTPIICRAEG